MRWLWKIPYFKSTQKQRLKQGFVCKWLIREEQEGWRDGSFGNMPTVHGLELGSPTHI